MDLTQIGVFCVCTKSKNTSIFQGLAPTLFPGVAISEPSCFCHGMRSLRGHTGKVSTATILPVKTTKPCRNLFLLSHICLKSQSCRECWVSILKSSSQAGLVDGSTVAVWGFSGELTSGCGFCILSDRFTVKPSQNNPQLTNPPVHHPISQRE